MFLIIILVIISLSILWNIKCFLIQNAADSYLGKKYNIEMTYKEMRFTIADPSGYYLTYYPSNNDNIRFTVSIYSSLYNHGYIEDNYLLKWFCWELQENMNLLFSEYLEELGKESKIQVILNYENNDEIDDNLTIFENQKKIPYYLIIHTDCVSEDKFRDICNEITSQGYKPQKIKMKTINSEILTE